MIKDWPKIREKELFFIREITRLKKLRQEKNLATSSSSTLKDNMVLKDKDVDNKNKNSDQSHKNKDISEEEQWDINNKLLTESYEEEEELMKEILIEEENYDASEEYNDFINSLDDIGLHNLENAMEAMEVENNSSKRRRSTYGETSVKREGEKERPTRSAGKWPPENGDFQPSYIPGQYKPRK